MQLLRRGESFRLRTVLAFTLCLSLLAAACGGSDDDEGQATGSTGGGPASSVAEGQPKPGGRVIAALDAESNGWHPQFSSWAVAGLQVASSVYDTLTQMGTDGKAKPMLAESVTNSPDFKVWTLKIRQGITFHDGTPLDAAAVKTNLDGQLKSPQNSPAIANVQDVQVTDPMTVVVNMKSPWVAFPAYLTGAIGMMASPKALADKDGLTQRPVGTGPFIFKEWIPNNRFIAAKNPSYWQKGLPYLDEIEFRPILETQSRESSLKSNTIDVLHTTDTQTVVKFRKDNQVKIIESDKLQGSESEEFFYYINTAKAPTDDVRVRKAIALATDRKQIIDTVFDGVGTPTNGPFSPGSKFAGDTGFKLERDLAEAKRLVDEYEKEKGPIRFEFGTTNVGRNLQVNTLIQQQLKEAGIDTDIKQFEQNAYIQNLLLGNYQVYAGRQFGAADPDQELIWWISATASDPGKLALNFVRIKDPQLDAALIKGRATPDDAGRKEAYQEAARRLGETVPYNWILKINWMIASKRDVNGLNVRKLPDGSDALTATNAGIFDPRQVWRG